MASTQASIFYSWQSELPTKTNWTLIEDALKKAAKALRQDDSLGVEPVIDRDTRGVAGSPDIHLAILAKIAQSDVAVFDVSFVQNGSRLHPNPNVLIELGYALGTIGWERVILVLNTVSGEAEELPFDIRAKRAIKYSMRPEEEPADARTNLATAFEARIREVLTQHPRLDSDLTAVAIKALHDGKPGALASVRSALLELTLRLSEKMPTFTPDGDHLVAVLAAYAETGPTVARFIELVTAIVDCRSAEAFDSIFGCLEQIASLQEKRPTGSFVTGAFDVQRMLIRELPTVVSAICLKANAWALLRRLATHHFKFTHDLRERSGHYSYLLVETADFLSGYEKTNNLRPGLGFMRVISDRYKPDLSTLALDDLREADYFLYVASELRSKDGWGRWKPLLFWTDDNHGPLEWLRRAKSSAWTDNIAKAMGLEASQFTSLYQERWTQIAKIFDWLWTLSLDLEQILIRPDEVATRP